MLLMDDAENETIGKAVIEIPQLLELFVASPDTTNEVKLATLLGLHATVARLVDEVSPSVPKGAPELFSGRTDRRENPVGFIKRVYAQWLGRGLTMAHIRQLDYKLYQSLRVWLHHNGRPHDFDLPTKKRRNDMLMRALGDPDPCDPVLDAGTREVRRLRVIHHARVRGRELARGHCAAEEAGPQDA
jgi:hypothetical protein